MAAASRAPDAAAAAVPLRASAGPSHAVLSPTAAAVAGLPGNLAAAFPARQLLQPSANPPHVASALPEAHRPVSLVWCGPDVPPTGPASPHGTESGVSVAESFADALTDLEDFVSADEA
mmetsp:Transcript_24543/g.79246  ORF Transcript_24543/g.79246 Transcript_24543/m.79246 type:complete len:119 (-) Transcript_24543:350-706(-)|eukprot:scaffold12664_cov107-Isochrysis_galbana.AAC.2